MGDTFKEGNRRPCRGGRSPFIAAIAVLGLAVALAAAPAVAKKITGTKRSELIVGTKGADRINGKGGNDLIKGKRGNDRLNGGKGSNRVVGGKGKDKVIGGPKGDTLIGGPGVDRHFGGPGNDLLNAADGRRDAVIDAGPGTNKCIIDTTLELDIVRGCATIQAGRPGGGQGGRGGGGGGDGGGGPGPGEGLGVISVETPACSPLPPPLFGCFFHITGDGADAPVGTVEGGGGVTAFGLTVSITDTNWDAVGLYNCTGPGFLRVIIGSESVDVPVECT